MQDAKIDHKKAVSQHDTTLKKWGRSSRAHQLGYRLHKKARIGCENMNFRTSTESYTAINESGVSLDSELSSLPSSTLKAGATATFARNAR